MSFAEWFGRLPTGAKLLLILTAVLLPIGIGLALVGNAGIHKANVAVEGRAQDQSRAAATAIESLIARNALALRVASNGALASGPTGACERARGSLAIVPAVAQNFELETGQGEPICSAGQVGDTGKLPLVAPGGIQVRIAPTIDAVAIRVGIEGGMATALVPAAEIRTAAIDAPGDVAAVALHDGARDLNIIGASEPADSGVRLKYGEWQIGNGALFARIGAVDERITTRDRLILLLPLLMWVTAALMTWVLVSRLLIRPLRLLQDAVMQYQPGETDIELPRKLGPSTEIQELRDAFARAIDRVQESEQEMAGALDGQRRLVREVHHRVKNNLQVVASLLNIHGRSAGSADGRAAYAGIGRRVGALSIVHRNHFAEMEENRGISLRPLLTELAAELRAGAPDTARGLRVDLELDPVYTTQDVAVAVAFLMTEIIEFAMLNCPEDPVEIALRRTSELTARLSIASQVLVPEEDDKPEKVQFERIIGGLAKQLRSSLDRKLGRYSVDLPVFPAA